MTIVTGFQVLAPVGCRFWIVAMFGKCHRIITLAKPTKCIV